MTSNEFEDIVFILNIRIKTVKDTLRLRPPPELFQKKSLDDLLFIDQVLAVLTKSLNEDSLQNNLNGEIENFLDAEWQFNQLLIEFSNESSPFMFPENRNELSVLRESSDMRRKEIEATGVPAEIARSEPGVSSAELSSLFGGN